MNFEDAVKLHKSGKDVYRESEPDINWCKNSMALCWTNPSDDTPISFTTDDTTATDWAVFEEKKVFNLSDKVESIMNINGSVGCVDCYCKLEDIQQFITEIKTEISSDDLGLQELLDVIDSKSGERFK